MRELRIDRGSEVTFKVTFLDEDGDPLSPTAAEVRVSYKRNSVDKIDTIPMSSVGNAVYVAKWDTSNADAGVASWHAATLDGPPASRDGDIIVNANSANPPPAAP